MKRFVHATKPKGPENGAGDNQSYFNCFQNQVSSVFVYIIHDNTLCNVCVLYMCVCSVCLSALCVCVCVCVCAVSYTHLTLPTRR